MVRPDYYGALHWPARTRRGGRGRWGIPVLCDEAHGAHLNWDADVPTAGALGADVWVQSAHKTLPALNGAAWLHAGPGVDAARLRAMLRAVQTSSPSFVTLLALDDARAWMEHSGAQALARLKAAAARFHAQAAALGYADGQDEPGWAYDRTRVVLRAPQGGYALSEALAARGVDVEMSDACRVVCILSPVDGPERLERLARALRDIAADGRRGPDGTGAACAGGSGAACGTAERVDETGGAGMPGAARGDCGARGRKQRSGHARRGVRDCGARGWKQRSGHARRGVRGRRCGLAAPRPRRRSAPCRFGRRFLRRRRRCRSNAPPGA